MFTLLLACRPTPSSTPAAPAPLEQSAPPIAEVSIPPSPPAPDEMTKNLEAGVDRASLMKRAAEGLLRESPCTEIAMATVGKPPVAIALRIAANGEVVEIIRVTHGPERKALADCYIAQLKAHRFVRANGNAAVEIELELPSGALDKDVIRRVVREHIGDVRACYSTGLERDPKLTGRVSIQFTIGPTGEVSLAVVQESSVKDPEVGRCITDAVKAWKFPEPEGGGNVVVTYPFVLEAG